MKPIKQGDYRSNRNLILKTRTVLVAGFLFYLTSIWLAQSTPPVLTIAPTGTNTFSITITNGDSAANYELYRTPVLADANYPWMLASVGQVGQTNFIVGFDVNPAGFFRVNVGSDADGDGIPNYLDADPNNPAVGTLTITIDNPLNGNVFN